jgi:hypothetical protein
VVKSLIDNLTKKRSEFHDFEYKFKRLIEWFEHFRNTEMNYRIDGLTLEASLDILKNEIRNIIADKRRHVNDLVIAARVLQTHSNDQMQLQIVKQQIDQLEQIINTTEELVEKRYFYLFLKIKLFNALIRIKKTEMILKMLHDFEQGLENLRSWMDTIETSLQKPISITNLNASELRANQQSISVR